MAPDTNQNNEDQESQFSNLTSAYRKAMPYINLVYVMIASILMIGALGWFIDDYFQTKPFYIIIGIFAGLGLGFYGFFKGLKKLEEKNN
jgi:F0F1-type ATP synthase assembly protein I